jgi:hypothetical protein
MSNKTCALRAASAVVTAVLISGCAQIAATDADLPAPALSVALTATAADGPFSSIPGGVTVQSATLKHFTTVAPTPAFADTGTNGRTVTYTFTAAPEFVNGDVLTVTWSADAVPMLGSHYSVHKTTTYSFHGRVGR